MSLILTLYEQVKW